MNLFLKFVVFILAFVLGIFAASVFISNYETDCCATPTSEPTIATQKSQRILNGRVSVEYTGWRIDDGVPIITFLISNGSEKELTYSGHTREVPFPMITANGVNVGLGLCGTGAREYAIESGETVEVGVSGWMLRDLDRLDPELIVGYSLKDFRTGEYETHRSNEFRLEKGFIEAQKKARL